MPAKKKRPKVKLPSALETRVRNLQKVLAVNGQINSVLDLDQLLGIIMNTAANVMRSKAASLMLLDEKTNDLIFKVALGCKGGELKEKFRVKLGEGIAGTVAQNGRPVIVNDVQKDKRFAKRFDNSTGFVTAAILCVPLKVKGRLIGVLEAINPLGRKDFTREDLKLFEIFSDQAALALENARLHEAAIKEERARRELAIAHEIQQNFLPDLSKTHLAVEVAASSIPARDVGGDFYDVISLSDSKTGLIIGDVSGKGVPAALYMVRAISEYRYLAPRFENPGELLEKLNAAMSKDNHRGMFVTMACMVLDHEKQTLRYSLAGHPPLLRKKPDGAVDSLPEMGGLPIGIAEGSYNENSLDLRKGDLFAAYTDGVTEARNPAGADYTVERLKICLSKKRGSAQEIAQGILEELKIFSGEGEAHDDTTLLTFRIS